MGDLVGGSRRVAEVIDQFLHRRITGRNEVNGLHRRQRFAFLIDILHQGDALSADVVHLATCGHHPHGKLINHQDPPFHSCRLLLLLDYLIHDLCTEKKGFITRMINPLATTIIMRQNFDYFSQTAK